MNIGSDPGPGEMSCMVEFRVKQCNLRTCLSIVFDDLPWPWAVRNLQGRSSGSMNPQSIRDLDRLFESRLRLLSLGNSDLRNS